MESIHTQMAPGDELLLSVNDNAPWGHRARNEMMEKATRDMLLFMDDDDIYLPGGLEMVRQGVGEWTSNLHIFKMEYMDGSPLWRQPVLALGNLSTQMIVAPNIPGLLGHWGDRYEGDFDFACSTAQKAGEPFWHEEIIARYRA
jgi:glycosyltransferase involved in cell wall biosynthesis